RTVSHDVLSDLPAPYATTLDSLTPQFFLDQLAKVSILYSIRDSINRNLSLDSHYPHPWRDEPFDLGDQTGGLRCRVGIVLSSLTLFIQLGSGLIYTFLVFYLV